MSDLKSRQLAADLLSQTLTRKPPPVRGWHLAVGVLWPAAVILFELATRWCAQALFDPMPTLWHTAAVAAVPAGNLAIWLELRRGRLAHAWWLAAASGATLGIAAFYALVFLPLSPLAVVAVIFYGIGLLPLAPLAAFASAWRLAVLLKRRAELVSFARPLMSGFAAGLALLIALDIPAAATRLGVQWASSRDPQERERGLALIRALGDGDLLLRLCYDNAGRPSGLLSAFVMFSGSRWLDGGEPRQFTRTAAELREIYFRAYGEPFNARPAPFAANAWARFDGAPWDNDHGGAIVGGRIPGLSLVSSRIDGSIAAADAVAYLEWVVEFRNTSAREREARVEIALPPGGAVTRATLWINGEEREAAFGGRGQVREAYERVAVRLRRDPLLVTSRGAGRVLAQAFPVPRDGGTIKFKIGITAPLALDEAGKAKLVLPAILDHNTSLDGMAAHGLWIESKSRLTADAEGLEVSETQPGLYRLAGSIDGAGLTRARPTIVAERPTHDAAVVSRFGTGNSIRHVEQVIASRPAGAAPALVVVVDGSAQVGGAVDRIAAALAGIPAGTPVGIIAASGVTQRVGIAPWSQAQQAAVERLLRSQRFTGGHDNNLALADALMAAEMHENATVLWIHGPQPIRFSDTASRLEQAGARLSRKPAIWLYAVAAGPNEALPDVPWAWEAQALPATGDVGADLEGFLAREIAAKERAVAVRKETAAPSATHSVQASGHVARLWARDRVLAMMREKGESARGDAVALATEFEIVTPVSGAVVLETQQQYDEMRLAAANPGSVPTVPEPHEWALIIMAALSLLWLMRQGRGAVAA